MPKHRYYTCAECRHSKDNDTTEDVERAERMQRTGGEYEVQEYTCITCERTRPWWWFSTWPTGGTKPVSRTEGVKQFV